MILGSEGRLEAGVAGILEEVMIMRSALIVVDMLDDFVDGALKNRASEEIIEPIAELASRVRGRRHWVVIYANDAHREDDVELRVLPPHAMAGTPGARVIGDLAPQPGDVVVEKRFYSAFTETALAEVLGARDVGRLVLVGQHTDCCVRHTSYDAFSRGLDLVVCPDATTVFEPGSEEPVSVRQKRALWYLRTYYGASLEPSTAVA